MLHPAASNQRIGVRQRHVDAAWEGEQACKVCETYCLVPQMMLESCIAQLAAHGPVQLGLAWMIGMISGEFVDADQCLQLMHQVCSATPAAKSAFVQHLLMTQHVPSAAAMTAIAVMMACSQLHHSCMLCLLPERAASMTSSQVQLPGKPSA